MSTQPRRKGKLMRIRTLAMAATALMCAGCNSGTGTGGSGATHGQFLDACTLLTAPEAEAIMGQPPLTTTRDTSGGYITSCTYLGKIDSAHGAVIASRLQILAFTNAGVHVKNPTVTAQSYVAGLRTTLTAGHWVDVTGVGSDAIYISTVGKISMYKGDVESDIVYMPLGHIDTTAAVKASEIAAGIKIAEKL